MLSSIGLWKLGAAFTASGITAGAFGAHALSKRLGDKGGQTWGTAAHYLIANGVALLAISQHPKFGNASNTTRGLPKYAGALIGTGAVLFSGSIFLLLLDRARFRFLGPVTPLGGLCMITGYVALLL